MFLNQKIMRNILEDSWLLSNLNLFKVKVAFWNQNKGIKINTNSLLLDI